MLTLLPISIAIAVRNTCRGILLFSHTSISAVQVYQKVTYYNKFNSKQWYAKTGTSNYVLPLLMAKQISRNSIKPQKSPKFSKQLLWWFNTTCPASQRSTANNSQISLQCEFRQRLPEILRKPWMQLKIRTVVSKHASCFLSPQIQISCGSVLTATAS